MNNLGRKPDYEDNHFVPQKWLHKLEHKPQKVISGVGESLVLTQNNELLSFGGKFLFKAHKDLTVLKSEKNILDADVDRFHAAYLTTSKELFIVYFGRAKPVWKHEGLKAVACGFKETFAVCESIDGDRVYSKQLNLKFTKEEDNKFNPCTHVNKVIQKHKTSVAKLRAVNLVCAMLLSDGHLYTWGENSRANVGVPGSQLIVREKFVEKPINPLSIAHIHGKVIDFSLSSNVLIVLTEDKKVYHCGMEQTFILQEAPLPDGEIPAKVGCWESNFFIVAESGKVFSRFHFENDNQPVRFYGDVNLYGIDKSYFDGGKIDFVGGKYTNTVAITE